MGNLGYDILRKESHGGFIWVEAVKTGGKVGQHDTVQTSGASIRIQDAKRTVLWKAP